MNEINMAGLNAMGGGPITGGIPMMNNVASGGRPPMPINNDQRSQLNTYIYEYFLRNSMFECAKALLESGQPLNILKGSPARRSDDNGNSEEGGEDSKHEFDPKRSVDLPDPNLPKECPESCFLYEWWCLFWDMFNAQRGKAEGRNVLQYFTHTQAQSRSKQEQQQMMLRGLRNDMSYPQGYNSIMRSQANGGMAVNPQNELRKNALQNNRNATPTQIQMLQQQQKQQQLQRDPSAGENQQRPQSPATAENAPSPSKRPRLDGAGFNSQVQMPNGRGQGGGIPQQYQNMPNAPNAAAQRLAGYQASLGQQQQSQMPNVKNISNSAGPLNRGSPMMTQGQQDGGNMAGFYNHGDVGPNGMRSGPGGQPGTGANGALHDYQMQLMLLEQQNKRRLMMARQEHDNTIPRPEGSQVHPGSAPNGQNFPGTSPQGARAVSSPNPGDQSKRTPHINQGGISSPLPEGQSRSSPSGAMNFNNLPGAPMDPGMNPQYFSKINGMDPNLVGAMSNGMRPQGSHPNNFNQMTSPAQIMAARHQAQQHAQQQAQQAQQQQAQHAQQQQQAQQQQNWQPGPSAQPMMTQASQGQTGSQQSIGTPQQRNMPPPSMPAGAVAANSNGRTPQATTSPGQTPAPPTPQQANKANPKKKTELKDSKAKKGSAANLNAGATPSADAETTGATPTPATPMTPVHKQNFNNGQNSAVQPATNGQVPAPNTNIGISQQQDPLQSGGFNIGESSFSNFDSSLDFSNPGNGSMDVLQDFDFDSFLHQDGGDALPEFNFDASGFLDSNEIGAD